MPVRSDSLTSTDDSAPLRWRRAGFIMDQFAVPSPAQQLLDRFLFGYNQDGAFRKPAIEVLAHFARPVAGSGNTVDSRVTGSGLRVAASVGELASAADRIVIALHEPSEQSICEEVIAKAGPQKHCFIYGLAGRDVKATERLFDLARNRGVNLRMGSEAEYLLPLPEVKLPITASADRALVVSQGVFPEAEAAALEAIFTVLDHPASAASALKAVQPLARDGFWERAYSPEWRELLAAAVSRSNTIHGDPDRDGRTQDIVGLHLLEKLAPMPRGWVIDFANGFRLCLLVLDGAFSDMNFAVQLRRGGVLSRQLYRPPLPMQDHFSGMAAGLIEFFEVGSGDWRRKPMLIARAIEQMVQSHSSHSVRG